MRLRSVEKTTNTISVCISFYAATPTTMLSSRFRGYMAARGAVPLASGIVGEVAKAVYIRWRP